MSRLVLALFLVSFSAGAAQAQADAPPSAPSSNGAAASESAPAPDATPAGNPPPTATPPAPPANEAPAGKPARAPQDDQFSLLPDDSDAGTGKPHSYESPQHFAFEVRLGPYSPHIDSSAGLTGTPFKDLFNPGGKGEPKGKLLTSLEFDWQFLHKPYGTFGIGHVVGFYRRTTHSLQYLANDPATPCDSTKPGSCVGAAGDTTALNILPLQLLFVYRFEYLAEHLHIPLVPYLKTGLAYYIWWIENGGGFLSVAEYTNPMTGNSDKGYGGTFGWVLNPGGTIDLDFIDRAAGRVLDSEIGINHTYFFCELNYSVINGFGQRGRMDLSDTAVAAGIGFEF